MSLKTIRDPTLPSAPLEEEKDDFERTTRFRKGQLVTLQELQESVYDDLKDHHELHEDGGSGEISITGLSGLLADDQHVLDAEVLAVAEDKTKKGVASGYASLDSTTKVPIAEMASGTPDGTKFIRDDRTLAVPSGGDPGEGHITILTWHYSGITQGTWVFSKEDGSLLNGFYYNETNAQNDRIDYKAYLAAGTYTVSLLYKKLAGAAIITVLIDGVSVGTVDAYGGTVYNNLGTIANVVIASSGLKTISLKAATRNASNTTGWGLFVSSIALFRTA